MFVRLPIKNVQPEEHFHPAGKTSGRPQVLLGSKMVQCLTLARLDCTAPTASFNGAILADTIGQTCPLLGRLLSFA
jgi:hypothetical protein